MENSIEYLLENEWLLIRNKSDYTKKVFELENELRKKIESKADDAIEKTISIGMEIDKYKEYLKRIRSELARVNAHKFKTKELDILTAKQVPIIEILRARLIKVDHDFCCCPFHKEKTASMKIYPSTNTFYCFGCNKSGDVITLVRELDQCDFPTAVNSLI